MPLEHRRYGSKHAALRVDAQGQEPILHPQTGAVVGHKKPLVAEFGVLGPEYVPRDEKGEAFASNQFGEPYVAADIRGHFWSSEIAQAENGWTDEETEAVIASVEFLCKRQPDLCWRLEETKVPLPWPTYDSQTAQNVIAFAIEGGMVGEALAYELQNQARKTVVSALQDELAKVSEDEQAEQALSAV